MKKPLFFLRFILMTAAASPQSIRKGDTNNDKTVNSNDVIEVVNVIMGKPSTDYNVNNADANRDDEVNAADVVEENGR